jgi:hypothetical protein
MGSTDFRSPGNNNPLQYNPNGVERSLCPADAQSSPRYSASLRERASEELPAAPISKRYNQTGMTMTAKQNTGIKFITQ